MKLNRIDDNNKNNEYCLRTWKSKSRALRSLVYHRMYSQTWNPLILVSFGCSKPFTFLKVSCSSNWPTVFLLKRVQTVQGKEKWTNKLLNTWYQEMNERGWYSALMTEITSAALLLCRSIALRSYSMRPWQLWICQIESLAESSGTCRHASITHSKPASPIFFLAYLSQVWSLERALLPIYHRLPSFDIGDNKNSISDVGYLGRPPLLASMVGWLLRGARMTI
jgi:hypothetical protein